jgi:hypothetical protein
LIKGRKGDLVEGSLSRSGHWERLHINVYQSDFFIGDVNEILKETATFYAKYAIQISWTLHKLHTPSTPTGEMCLSTLAEGPEMYRPSMKLHTYSQILRQVRIPAPNVKGVAPLYAANPDLDWYQQSFPAPSVFFVGDLWVKGIKGLWDTPDLQGVTTPDRSYVFIPFTHAYYYDPYSYTLAHELGAVLGLSVGGTGLMGEYHGGGINPGIIFLNNSLDSSSASYLSPQQVYDMRNSNWLTDIKDPGP